LTDDAYVFVSSPSAAGEVDLTRLRGYLLADAFVRFRRANGAEVCFTLALEDGSHRDALRGRLGALDLSFDWDRALAATDPEVDAGSRWLLDALATAGLAYRRGHGWYLHGAEFNQENDRQLDELGGWEEPVRKAQRKLLHRVDGFDFDATALDGSTLSVFTGHPEAVSEAAFVGLSPLRPELDGWLDDPDARRQIDELRDGDWSETPIDQLPVVEVGMSVQVPSVPQPLPILVSPAIDVRFGPAAILGIPSADPVDRALAKRLPKAGGLAWKVESKPPKTTPAVRYLIEDMPLARGEGDDVASATIDARLNAAWMELALAVPPGSRGQETFDSPELARRLPTTRTVLASTDNEALLDMRTLAKALRDLDKLAALPDGEPHGPVLMHAPIALEGTTLDEAVGTYGSDALRFALLYAAAPGKRFSGTEEAVRHAAALLAEIRGFAEGRLDGVSPDDRIDAGDGLRRKLASWCDVAIVRTTENLDQLDMHRATRNVKELFARIQDFEQRVRGHRGEVAGDDREAVAVALLTLVQLLAPISPALAGELWAKARTDGQPHAAWPAQRRQATPA
jgi:leucyl-tRNA synthetase